MVKIYIVLSAMEKKREEICNQTFSLQIRVKQDRDIYRKGID